MKRPPTLLPLFLLLGCSGGEGEEMPVGSTAPNTTVETLQSPATTVSLGKKRGKVVLLDFWATWCGPCREVTPALERIYAKHKAEGLDAMAISNEAREIVANYEQKRPHEMPVYLDANVKAGRAFGVVNLPTTIVIDRGGHIVYRKTGVSPDTEAEIAAAVETALGKG